MRILRLNLKTAKSAFFGIAELPTFISFNACTLYERIMRRGIETGLKRMFEKKGYAVVGVGGSRYVLAGNRRSIYIVLPKRTKRKRVTSPEKVVKSLIKTGEKFYALPVIAVRFGRRKWVLKEISRPERVTVRIDEESNLVLG